MDDVNDKIDFGDIDAFDGLTTFTYISWVKANAGGTVDSFDSVAGDLGASSGAGNTHGWSYLLRPNESGDDDVFLDVRNGSSAPYAYSASNNLPFGSWRYSVFYYNGGGAGNSTRLRYWVTDTEVTLTYVGTIPTTMGANDRSLNFGSSEGGLYSPIAIAYAAFFTSNLTTTMMQEYRWKPDMIADAGLFAPVWGVNSPEIDLSGNSRTGTLTGTVANNDGPPVMFGGGLPL